MDAAAYLQRIDYHGPREPTVSILSQLHSAHMYSVPFENLDIPLGRPIVLSLPSLFDKIVRRRRGGFCYELNGLFAWLLQEIGFDVQMLSGRVFNGSVPGPEFDHMILLVNAGEKLLADVGFGDSFIEPVLLNREAQALNGDSYRLAQEYDDWVLYRQRPATNWEPQYAFSLQPRRLDEFRTMCQYHQTSPDSSFTRKSVCSLATEDGRVTLSNDQFIVTSRGNRQEHTVATTQAYQDLLRIHFRLDLGADVDAATLMAPSSRAK
jgi:N-hydroxyarylamine O-acetyltransferase